MSFIEGVKLNKEQLEAVTTTEGPLLIFAGAGSGKTRVLTHRVAHLILDCDVLPYHILCITFTNKAANEMKERIHAMCGHAAEGSLVATFHSTCVRILRRDIGFLEGYTRNFTIYNDDDTTKLLNLILKEQNLDPKQFPVKLLKSYISNAKNSLKTADDLKKDQYSPIARILPAVFEAYEKGLKHNNALDFDDLIIKTILLFTQHPDVLEGYQQRFRYIMVDEYQDTNNSQYTLIQLLGAKWKNVCVVGDDDQSIYSWRGADISIIRNFEHDYKKAKVIKLEQNYRSTTTILDAANTLIRNNKDRTRKKLWSEMGKGSKIAFQSFEDDRSEAAYVARTIFEQVYHGASYSDFAVLYRMNATSRNIEDALMAKGIRFKVYGGQRFYDRAEVKDALAYLRVLVNSQDEISLRRIINVPRRGIGQTTLEELSLLSIANHESLFSIIMFGEDYGIKPKTAAKLKGFISIIEDCASQAAELPPAEAIRFMLERTGLRDQYLNEKTEEAAARAENLSELVTAAAQYTQNNPDGTLEDYLEQVALVNDIEAADEQGNGGTVSLMTIHSSKGLEFKNVFVIAFEDGIFPISRAFDSLEALEEERRLAYVAITRTEKQLYLNCARRRMLHGYTNDMLPSRFMRELPSELIDNQTQNVVRHSVLNASTGQRGYGSPRNTFATNSANAATSTNGNTIYQAKATVKSDANTTYSIGMQVIHKTFGEGRIIGIKGSGQDTLLQIAFVGKGIKELVAVFAPLQKL